MNATKKPPPIRNGSEYTNKSLARITIRVGNGSFAPNPSNRDANVGMTFHNNTPTTMPAIAITATG